MSTGRYRAVFHTALAPIDALNVATREIRQWLIMKSRYADIDISAFDSGRARIGKGIIFLRDAKTDADGTQTNRWQLREHKDGGYWLSTLVVHAPSKTAAHEEQTWFWLDVEYVPTEGGAEDDRHLIRAAVPNLARKLLEAVDARDHWAYLRPRPELIRLQGVDELLEVLTDEKRRLPAVVASPHNEIDFESWKRKVDDTTKNLPGLASLYLLDPLAATEFNNAVGYSYGVWNGAIRTYLPGLDLAIDEEAVRHRVLSGKRILEDCRRASHLLAILPRRLAADGHLPEPLNKLTNRFTRTADPSPPPRPASPILSEGFSTLLKENDHLREEIAELQELLSAADYEDRSRRAEIANLQDELLEVTGELEKANQKIAELDHWVRTLRQRLQKAGHAAEMYQPPEEVVALPTQLSDVIARIEEGELSRVRFTGDVNPVWRLEEKAQSFAWAQTTWQVVLAFQDYADAVANGTFRGDFYSWCSEPPPGATAIPAGKVKPDESDTVKNNAKMRRYRELPVPPEVNPSECVFMGAHIRIGGGGGISSPRLHFYDDVRNSGKIYIGYLGPHLPVKSTN